MRDLILGITGALVGHLVLFSLPLAGSPNQGLGPQPVECGRVTIRLAMNSLPVATASAVLSPALQHKESQPEARVSHAETPVKKSSAQEKKESVVEQEKAPGLGGRQEQSGHAMPVPEMATRPPLTGGEGADEHGGKEGSAGSQAMARSDGGHGFAALVVQRINPGYPSLARKRGWQGTVVLTLVIDANGTLTELTVHSSSGHHILDKAAVEAVRKWRFRPAVAEKWELVGRRLLVPITFRLEN